MIEQCLSNKNESATVSKTKKISELNKALFDLPKTNASYAAESRVHALLGI